MKKRVWNLVLLLLLGIVPLTAFSQREPAAPQRPVFRNPVMIRSGEVTADGRIILRLYAPKAASVEVTGEWMPGQGTREAMTGNDTGLYVYETLPLAPELYAYNFIIDGITVPDPANVQMRRDGVRYQSFVIVPGSESELYIQKEVVAHGSVTKVWYYSEVLGMDRRMYVYTPPGYEGGTGKYPVFYLLHGAGGDEDAWTNMGREAQILDNLIAQGRAKPMIVVMTNGNANQAGAQNEVPAIARDQQQSMASFGSMAGRFEEHLVKDVIPFIEKNYRTLTGKDNRAIAGLSMGGGHTQTITNDNPGMFSYIGVFSMGIMNGFGRISEEDAAKMAQERELKIEALKNSGYKLYWIGCGKDDFVYQSVINLRETLDRHNFKYTYRESTGGHTWANWRIYLSEFAPLLFR